MGKNRLRNAKPKPWVLQNHFLYAVQNNDIATAESLFSKGVDIDSILFAGHLGKPAICICVERGYYKMAKLLIGRGCSLSLTTASGSSPLHLAVMYADSRLVKLLLKNQANVRALDCVGQTALHIACSRSSQAIVQALIDNGGDCNKLDDFGHSPLSVACTQGNCKIVSCLLRNGAKVNVTDVCGDSPLVYATAHQNALKLTRMLVAAGADVNLINSFDETPVMCAVKNFDVHRSFNIPDDLSVIEFLLNNGCRLDIATPQGQTLLHLAVCQRRVNLTQKLINRGCDVNARDRFGYTPLYYACRNGSENIVLMLIAAGSDLRSLVFHHTESLMRDCNKEMVAWMFEKCKRCLTLSEMCVLEVRKVLRSNVESVVHESDLPTTLKNLITLNAYC